MGFSIIAAIGKNRELGKNGKLLWRLPSDLKFFKETTLGHPIMMGRKTFESLPGVLPGRKHYVVSRQKDLDLPEGVETVNNFRAFVQERMSDPEEIFVIGGGMLYWEMLKFADKLYLTEIEAEDATADTFFPEFDKTQYRREELGKGEDNGVKFTFVRYSKVK